MSKIYVVTSGAYSGYHIAEVFLVKHKAELYCAAKNKRDKYGYGDYRIEEYENADGEIEGEIEIAWRYEINEGDRNAWGYIVPYTAQCLNEIKESKFSTGRKTAIVYLRKKSNSKALKIAYDMFAQYRAEKEGL